MDKKRNMGNFKIDRLKYYYSISGNINPPLIIKIRIWLTNFGFHVNLVFRFGQFSRRLYKKSKIIGILPLLISKILNFQADFFHHVVIHNNAEIGPGFYIVHCSNILIGPGKIGNNCTIHHNVTVGQKVANRDQGVPEIGDHVWIGTGVVISGAIKIGNNSTISSGCVLSKDIPDNCLVTGNPGRIISTDYDNSEFLTFKLPE